MPAVLRGAWVIEVTASELAEARRTLARAVEDGALGRGYTVSLEGETVVFTGGWRLGGACSGRLTLSGDGRASYELHVGPSEWARLVVAVLLACAVSLALTFVLGWNAPTALGTGALFGVGSATAMMVRHHRRERQRVRALLRRMSALPAGPPPR